MEDTDRQTMKEERENERSKGRLKKINKEEETKNEERNKCVQLEGNKL
jgi:hypothetical protein